MSLKWQLLGKQCNIPNKQQADNKEKIHMSKWRALETETMHTKSPLQNKEIAHSFLSVYMGN